jgi:hypothetical protein
MIIGIQNRLNSLNLSASRTASVINPPTNFAAALIVDGVRLTWTDSLTPNTEVHIERSIDGAEFTTLATVAYGVETYDDEDLDGTEAEIIYRIRAATVEVVLVPQVVSISVENATPDKVNILFDMDLDETSVPSNDDFSVSGKTLSGTPTVSVRTVTLTVTAAYVFGDTGTVAYTKPVSGMIKAETGGQTASFTGTAITNNVESTEAPSLASIEIANVTPTKVLFTFDGALDESSGTASSAFAVSGKTISGIVISGATVEATVTERFYWGDTATGAYTKPGSNPLKGSGGVDVDTFGETAITNSVVLDAATDVFIATGRYTDAPTTALKALVNKTFADLRTKGILAKTDKMTVYGLHEVLLSRQNWAKNASNSSLSATAPTHTPKQGFQGNGTSSYINTNFTPSTDAVNYTLAACAIVVMYRLIPTATGKHLLGAVNNGATKKKIDIAFYTTANERCNLNFNTNYNDQVNVGDGQYLGYTRTGGYIQGYLDGVATGANQARATDTELVDYPILELTYGVDGTPTTYNNGQISFSWYGGALSAQEHADLVAIMQYFYTNVGGTF